MNSGCRSLFLECLAVCGLFMAVFFFALINSAGRADRESPRREAFTMLGWTLERVETLYGKPASTHHDLSDMPPEAVQALTLPEGFRVDVYEIGRCQRYVAIHPEGFVVDDAFLVAGGITSETEGMSGSKSLP